MSPLAMRPVGDAVHAKGCRRENVQPSAMLEGWTFCGGCRRMVAPAASMVEADDG